MGDRVELVVRVCLVRQGYQGIEAGQDPSVELEHVLGGDEIVRVEAVEVAEAESRGVAELEVGLAQLFEDLFGASDVHVVVGAAGPEPYYIRAELRDELIGIDAVAEALVHGLALAVDCPAVGYALFVRSSLAERADRYQQRGLEPASVLVSALYVDGGGPEALVALHCGVVGGTGVEPAVEGVGLFREVLSSAVRADKAFGQKRVGLPVEPGVAAFLLEDPGNVFNRLVGADRLAAVVAVEYRDRQAPSSLAGDAPVGSLADHGAHSLLAPGGVPFYVLTGLDGLILEGVNGAEPLRGGAEDDRALAAPAVRVAVDHILAREQSAGLFHVV